MAITLRSYEFRKERQRTWAELSSLVTRIEKSGLRGLTPHELARLPVLYRATLSSLSVARAISLDKNLLEYLESLCARAYFCVYGSKRRLRSTLGEFFVHRFPTAVRRYKRQIMLAGLIFLLGWLTAYVLVLENADWYYSFIPSDDSGRDPTATTTQLREGIYELYNREQVLAVFASFLFSHNAQLGLTVFALGFVVGLPVLLGLFYNGLMIGAFTALYTSRGLGIDVWGWLLPHGITEIGAVVFCGGAGLVLAQAVVFPGRAGRMANLAHHGREAGVIVLGAVVMFFGRFRNPCG